MFGSKPQAQAQQFTDAEEIERYKRIAQQALTDKAELISIHKIATNELTAAHALALKQKEFDINHFKDEEMLTLRKDISAKDQEIAVLKKENEMLVRITDLNADVIDVKELVTTLINKLPEVKINSLTVSGNGSDK